MLPCSSGEQTVVLDTLYFGTAKPSGLVSAEEWAAFLEETVVQDFREGLTFWTVAGRWKNAAGLVLGKRLTFSSWRTMAAREMTERYNELSNDIKGSFSRKPS